MIVIGAPNSSNSMRLVEVAHQSGCDRALLVQRAADVDWGFLDGIERLGLTAGASAPDILVEELIDACRACYDVTLEEVTVTRENVHFNLPRALSPRALSA
jgi:4-hydroxy-3-methylbut-2-enyl diphosphate reductase